MSRAPTPGGPRRTLLTPAAGYWCSPAGKRSVAPRAKVARSPSGLVSDALELFLIGRADEGYQRVLTAIRLRAQNRSRPWSDSPSAPVWPAYLALHAFGPTRARELSLEARREAQKDGRLWLTPYHQWVSAGINFHAGAWDDALAELESGLEAAVATGTAWTSMATATQLQILVRRGELDTASATLQRWRSPAGCPNSTGCPMWPRVRFCSSRLGTGVQEAAALVSPHLAARPGPRAPDMASAGRPGHHARGAGRTGR